MSQAVRGMGLFEKVRWLADEFIAFMANHTVALLKAHAAKPAQGSTPLQVGTRLRR
jgi:hypothetical protein